MEVWRRVWRIGFVPQISLAGLEALRKGLIEDDPHLLQGATTSPPPLQCVEDWDVEGCCPLAYTGWRAEGKETVGETEEYFAKLCFEADQLLGESAACRFLLNFFDDTPRPEMIRDLLPEVELAIAKRLQAMEKS